MFVYQGLIDQNTSNGTEFLVVVLPSRIDVGSPVIVFRQSLDDDCQNLGDYGSFDTVIESVDIAKDGNTASLGCGGYNLMMQLPRDMFALYVGFQINGEATQLTSSMSLVTRKHLTKAESLSCEPVIFHGPVRINNQSRGNLLALVLLSKTEQGSAPVATHVCISWKSKVATTETPAASHVFRIEEGQEQEQQQPENQQDEQKEGAFFISGQTHEFQGSLNTAGDALELSLRSRCGFSDETDWTAVTISRLDKHQQPFQKLFAFGPNYVTVTNNSAEMVSCTIKSTTDKKGEVLTHAGLALALLGLLAGVPQAFSAVVAIGGLSLAAKSWKDMMWIKDTKNDESTAMLFPGDKIQHVVGGWGPFENDYDIVTVRNHIEEYRDTSGAKSYTFQVTMHSIIDAAYKEWTVTQVRDTGKSTQMVHLPLELPQEMVQRRLLFIDGLRPSGYANQSKKPPFALEEGSALSYNTAFKFGQGIYDSWYPHLARGRQNDAILDADGAMELAIVQGPESRFSQADFPGGYQMHHFDEDPFTPVLELVWSYVDSNSEKDTARRLIGTIDNSDGAMKLIEENEKRDKNTWAYCLERVTKHNYKLYAWAWRESISIRNSGHSGDGVYFVIRKWSPATAIVRKGD
ncbi:hypothetical protein V8C34DRAFT_291154 [Trichoderma compactum]